MEKSTNNRTIKVHYKMYKDGKHWVVAGIATALLGGGLLGVQLNAQADTTTTTTTNTTKMAQSSTIDNNQSVTKNEESKVTTNVDNSKKLTSSTAATKPTSSAADSTTTKATTDNAADQVAVNAEAANATKKEESVPQAAKPKETTTTNDTKTETTDQTKAANKTVQPVPVKTKTSQKNSRATTDIASGVDGTVNWRIDNNYNLHFGAGTMGEAGHGWHNNKVAKIIVEGKVILPSNSSNLFSYMNNLVEIDGADLFDTSHVTDMSGMFCYSNALTSLNVSNWDVSQVKDMSNMFAECSALTSLDVSKWNTGNVENLQSMFLVDHDAWYSSSLTFLDVSNWDVSHVTNMSSVFDGLDKLKSLDVSKWNTSNVTTMNWMFDKLSSVNKLDVSNWDTSNVTEMLGTFSGVKLNTIDVSKWNTKKVQTTRYMFSNNPNLTNLNLASWDMSNINDASVMFLGDDSLRLLVLGNNDKLQNTSLSDVPNNSQYTGYWRNVGTGTVTDPNGKYILSSADLMNNYNGSMADTYVWQPRVASSLDAHDSTLIAGPKQQWNAQDNFTGATDTNGQSVNFSQVKVNGTVNTSKPGEYPITYSYVDSTGATISKTITVTIVASKANITVHDTTVIAKPGATWNPADNFSSATDANGQALNITQLTHSGTVDLTKPGTYQVTYSYTDVAGNEISQVATIKVVADQSNVDGKNMVIIAGPDATWNPKDGFTAGTNAEGQPINFDDVKVMGADKVDPKTPGEYVVTYQYTDPTTGKVVTKDVTIDVVQSKASVNGHDSTIASGTTWSPADNFDGSTNAYGYSQDLRYVTVTGTVDTTKAGVYQITYSYTDIAGNKFTKVVNVTVTKSDDGGTTPTDPTNPTDPDNPTTPTDPTNPTDPDNPTTPTDPTNPVEPGNPTEPNIPSTPLEPSEPATPGEPNQPKPEEPSNPAMPDLPNTSVKPSNPGNQPGHDNHVNEPVAKPETVNSGKNNLSAKAQASKTAQAKLPQTNESKASASVLTVAGLVILALIGGSLGLTKKKRN